ncbi:hypothetical protein HXX76_006052 [Chlamydomonas incerta]|uniref:Uncharacterized protein n=1 Tax=Chlamydomonas incerta TaxID=51695 RepID=A0A835TEN8_CHLIN|nr:hypothetical protein HXX76_006052 [Chlamydomonas incerta]|eukprot:KAG2437400.1 hypothetical protein HXX76_006052 [Chlamydomonas incerta]
MGSLEPLPSALNSARQGHGLELKDKLTVRYAGDARHNNDVGAIQANHPVPVNCTVFYYELTVLDGGISGKIAIGFADKNFKLTRQPGWEVGSYGYHGDDGKKFIGSGMGEDYGPTFGAGDTVGAGIHLGRQELFFTKNGTKLKAAHRPVRGGLYPTIGLHSKGEMVQLNFGARPFVFDLEGMLAEERAAQRAAVERIPVSPGTSHALVRQYLLYHGYADTLAAFDRAAGITAADSSAAAAAAAENAASGLELRAELRRAIMAGDVDAALALLQARCPALLADAGRFGDVHFQLACQKYIELVRGGRVQEAVVFAQGTLAQLRGVSAAALESPLRDVVALIAYQQPETSPLAHLLGQPQREAVSDAVNTAVLAVLAADGGASSAPGAGAAPQEAPEAGAAGASGCSGSAAVAASTSAAAAAGSSGRGKEPAGSGGAGAMLRPALSVPEAAAAARSVSHVERLLQQLVAVQATLHEANGGQGGVFSLREHMIAPGAV